MPAQGFESEALDIAPPPPPDFEDDDADGLVLVLPTPPVGLGPLKPPPRAASRGEATRGDLALVPVAALEEARGFSLPPWDEGAEPKKENRERASSSSLSCASL